MHTSYQRTAGIDVSKKSLDTAYWPDRPHHATVSYTDAHCVKIARRFKDQQVELVVVEATGGYERRIVKALLMAGLPVHVAQPLRTKSFAKAQGYMAKNDRIDARMLAEFGGVTRPQKLTLARLKTQREQTLDDLRRRRAQLVDMRVREKNRLEKLDGANALIRREVQASIRQLQKKIDDYDQEMEALVRTDAAMTKRLELLLNEHGIGLTTALALIVGLPELGKVNRRKIAALVGVACYDNDSGAFCVRRSIRGGRKDVRNALYMADLSNIRVGAMYHSMYLRLQAAGKAKKVAQIACLRKFLIRLNTLMKQFYFEEARLAAA